MMIILLLLALLASAIILFMRQPSFGRAPSGQRQKRIQLSPNYRMGSFQNQSPTSVMAEGTNFLEVMRDGMFNRSKRSRPSQELPFVKTDLKQLNPAQNLLIWFGHSSYLMQINGKKILVDPVFSGHASPFSFMVKSFAGSDVYSADDMPDIDYLVITHDHWDHLDYKVALKLQPKTGKVITGLGVGAHLESWGFSPDRIVELDWGESVGMTDGFKFAATPGRHFTGRGLKRNQSIWCSFVLETPAKKVFIGGDSGYDTHFAKIGNEFGPFDLALLECGQYNKFWKNIHLMPEETVQAAIDLKSKTLMPVHWAKFALAYHAWDEPIERVTREASQKHVPIIHPLIGQVINLDEPGNTAAWWKGLN